jgi:hypothetical protein
MVLAKVAETHLLFVCSWKDGPRSDLLFKGYGVRTPKTWWGLMVWTAPDLQLLTTATWPFARRA